MDSPRANRPQSAAASAAADPSTAETWVARASDGESWEDESPATGPGGRRRRRLAALAAVILAALAATAVVLLESRSSTHKSAGAGVADHLHLHILPRWTGDANFMTSVAETRILPEEVGTTWQRLHGAFQAP